MIRDIQKVLERYGAWASHTEHGLYYSSVAARFRGLLPSSQRSRPSCCDDDRLIVNGAMACLKKRDPYLHVLLEWHYVLGLPVRAIGTKLGISHTLVLKQLQMAEGFIDSCLSMMDIKLDIDLEWALLNKSELVTTVPHRVDCYVMRILFGIPNSVIRLSALTIAMASPT